MVSEFWIRRVSRPAPRALLAIVLAITFSITPSLDQKDLALAAEVTPAFSAARVQSPPDSWSAMTVREEFNNNFGFNTDRDIGRFTSSGPLTIYPANSSQRQWGGTNLSEFAQIGSNARITLALGANVTYRYLGFYWTAGNASNYICLHNGGTPTRIGSGVDADAMTDASCVAKYSTSQLTASGSTFQTLGNRASYQGNPNLYEEGASCTAANPNGHCGEPFAFIHLFLDEGFTHVTFSGNGFELDTVTASTRESWELIDAAAGQLIGAETTPAFSLTTARVIPVDPRSQNVPFPGVLLAGAASNRPDATLCLTQVTDSSGTTPVTSSSATLLVSAPTVTGVTQNSAPPRFTFTGSQTAVRNITQQIRIISSSVSRSVASGSSVWLRASVQARANVGNASCQSTTNIITSVVIELRPIRLNSVNQLGIPID